MPQPPTSMSHACITAGCSRATWNGLAGQPCCRSCVQSAGKTHGPACEERTQRALNAGSTQGSVLEERKPRVSLEEKKPREFECSTVGCTRKSWNGQSGESCCRTCAKSNGHAHGPDCDRKYAGGSLAAAAGIGSPAKLDRRSRDGSPQPETYRERVGDVIGPATKASSEYVPDGRRVSFADTGSDGRGQDDMRWMVAAEDSLPAISMSSPSLRSPRSSSLSRSISSDSESGQIPTCPTRGCVRRPWNGMHGEYCCRSCQRSVGIDHGPDCNKRFKADMQQNVFVINLDTAEPVRISSSRSSSPTLSPTVSSKMVLAPPSRVPQPVDVDQDASLIWPPEMEKGRMDRDDSDERLTLDSDDAYRKDERVVVLGWSCSRRVRRLCLAVALLYCVVIVMVVVVLLKSLRVFMVYSH